MRPVKCPGCGKEVNYRTGTTKFCVVCALKILDESNRQDFVDGTCSELITCEDEEILEGLLTLRALRK